MSHGNAIMRAMLILAMLALLAAAGCAAREAREAKADRETEVLLVSSGFNMKMADTLAGLGSGGGSCHVILSAHVGLRTTGIHDGQGVVCWAQARSSPRAPRDWCR